MANWQPIGSGPIEYCVGDDGVTGVYWNQTLPEAPDSMLIEIKKDGDWFLVAGGEKPEFEAKHCKPRHRLIESADDSVCVASTEEVDGKPVRMTFVRTDSQGEWDVHWMGGWDVADDKQDAIDRAARYVETGE